MVRIYKCPRLQIRDPNARVRGDPGAEDWSEKVRAQSRRCRRENNKGLPGFEPGTIRIAAECSTTELQTLIINAEAFAAFGGDICRLVTIHHNVYRIKAATKGFFLTRNINS